MRVISLKALKLFWIRYSDAEVNLMHWHNRITKVSFKTPQEITKSFKDSDYVGNERIVFNICRNKYRLIAAFNYEYQLCYVKFIGTHKEYDSIDAKTVEFNS